MFDKKFLIIPLIVASIFVQSSHTIRIGLKAELFNGICNTTTIKTPSDTPVSVFYPISNHFLKYWNDDKELNKEVYAFWMSCKSHGTNQSDVISTKDRVIVDKNELVCIEFVTGKEEECKVRDENNKIYFKCLRGINAWSQPTGHCDFEK